MRSYIYLEGFRPLFQATQYILKSFLEINTNYLWICISINPDAYSQNPIFRSEKKHDKLRFLLSKTQQNRNWKKITVRVSTFWSNLFCCTVLTKLVVSVVSHTDRQLTFQNIWTKSLFLWFLLKLLQYVRHILSFTFTKTLLHVLFFLFQSLLHQSLSVFFLCRRLMS